MTSPTTSPVTLRLITQDTYRPILKLAVAPAQKAFVADNAVSLAQALFHPEEAWYRAIYAGETPVGFAMIDRLSKEPLAGLERVQGQPFLWRFMIGTEFQGKGYGKAALDLLVAEVRGWPGVRAFYTSYIDAPGGPGPFYKAYGFQDTGVKEDDELVLELLLGR